MKRIRLKSLVGSFAVAVGLCCSPSIFSAQSPPLLTPCAWPLEVTGKGITNVAAPDTNATYWVMPVDTSRYQSMQISGQFPRSRFFSFTSYRGTGGVVSSIIDTNIAPNAGSSNPFMQGATGASGGDYSVQVDADANVSGNHLQWASTKITFVIYRIYVADQGLSREAGAPLPSITLTDTSGNSVPLSTCPVPIGSIGSGSVISNLITQLEANNPKDPAQCRLSQSQPEQLPFDNTSHGLDLFPNPVTTYISTQKICARAERVVVVRGKAPDFPNTFNGSTIFQAALPGEIQLRYWSVCNNQVAIPFPVVACQADHAMPLDADGFYTVVISADRGAPSWVPTGTVWLPWGDTDTAKRILFREMLPAEGFSISGSYLPTGVFCDRSIFVSQGWQGCFAAAGMSAPQ